MNIICHIAGFYGSGKTYTGRFLSSLDDKVKHYDTDSVGISLNGKVKKDFIKKVDNIEDMNWYFKEYQKLFDSAISKFNKQQLILTGIHARYRNIDGSFIYRELNFNTDNRFVINLPPETIIDQMLKRNKKDKKDVDMNSQIEKCITHTEMLLLRGYKLMTFEEIVEWFKDNYLKKGS